MPAMYAAEGLGAFAVSSEFSQWGWEFRAEPVAGFGIDAHVEPAAADGRPLGSPIALQIKAGPSYFAEPVPGGWRYRGTDPHLASWQRHCLPVVLLVHNPVAGITYWAHLRAGDITPDGDGWQLMVPGDQVLSAGSREQLAALAGSSACAADDPAEQSCAFLPPSAGQIIRAAVDAAPDPARRLATWLAAGRAVPRLTAESLIAAAPSWLPAARGHGEAALAAYAAEHGLADLAAEAFTRAAGYREQPGGALLARAALAAAQAADGDRARLLLSLAVRNDPPPLLLATAQAAVSDLEQPEPCALPELLAAAGPAERAAEPACLAYLGARALRCGDPVAAARYYEEGWQASPESTTMMVGLARSLAAWAATGPPDAAASGLARLAAAAREALDQRRRWSGPSSQALARLIEGELLAGRYASAARLATPAPDGEARDDEASADEVVILGTRAALLAGDRDRGEALAARAASEHAAEAVGALLAGQEPPPGPAWRT
jgi:Domain of unknown function (DUF4365)